MVTKANAKYHSGVEDPSNLFVLESYVGKVGAVFVFELFITSHCMMTQGIYGQGLIYKSKGRMAIADKFDMTVTYVWTLIVTSAQTKEPLLCEAPRRPSCQEAPARTPQPGHSQHHPSPLHSPAKDSRISVMLLCLSSPCFLIFSCLQNTNKPHDKHLH